MDTQQEGEQKVNGALAQALTAMSAFEIEDLDTSSAESHTNAAGCACACGCGCA